jgi:F-box-like
MIFVSLICSQTCELIVLNRRHHILNDDILLNIFHLYRLTDPDEYDREKTGKVFAWSRQRWWYRLAHVCRQWRSLILESPSRLDLHLYCTNGVPVADMLTHSPPLPLTIYYHNAQKITAEDESGILLALSHRDRVRRIKFFELPNLGKFVTAMDDQFPILERLYLNFQTEVALPETFQAPNLRNLSLGTASIPMGSPLLTTATRLVTLTLLSTPGPASSYFPPSYILTRLSLMPQLERLVIEFCFPTPNRDVESQLHQTPDITTLPNLCWFSFTGVSAYLERLVARISAPSLSILHVSLFNQLPFTFPHLFQFMKTSENLRFTAVRVTFDALAVTLHTAPWKWDTPLMLQIRSIYLDRGDLDWRVASAAQLFDSISPVLSVVEQVTFSYEHNRLSEWRNDVDRSQWCELLRPFTNVKTIHVQDDLANKIFHSLPSDDGEPPLEVLPNLEEVGYSGRSDTRDAFTRFLNERQVSGHPVSLRLVDPSIFD